MDQRILTPNQLPISPLTNNNMSSQFYSLKALKARVESLIEAQGEDSQCAAWIYTSEDIVKYDEEGDEVQQPQSLCDSVLCNLQDYDSIHQSIVDAIESELAWVESNTKVAA
ncbi:hypothetical protein Syn7803C86_57 [Synechococcus phage ACG-2014a]|uniref:Uncharacterized protein n=3 Tax=Acionnavirus monteraybay TaxID=2734078 RepID=A0A0E3F2B2_9CAUD|nr:hypothetical protein Syn7803C86_57 [Synechococcus phage ACG-2014a]AIX45399.1 hypothetical protein Syn7803C33_56 [Synechococcus phage ACG-2014a]